MNNIRSPLMLRVISRRQRLPVVLQLFILLLMLGGVFVWLYFNQTDTTEGVPIPLESGLAAELVYAPPAPPLLKEEDITIAAEAAYVWDVASQRALYNKNAAKPLPLASITKLMTATLAYELAADDVVAPIADRAIRQEGDSGLSAGETLKTKRLRDLALISSSNDAAYALSMSVGELLGEADPAAQFVAGMNIRAAELGLDTLVFQNPTGLDESSTTPGAVGSARDVSFLMEHIILEYPEIVRPTTKSATRIYNTAGAYHDIANTNTVATSIPNLIGSKTGYTDLAGGNLTIAFDVANDRPIIITVLGSTRDARFTDVLTLVAAVEDSFATLE